MSVLLVVAAYIAFAAGFLGIVVGLVMSFDRASRSVGILFALWWIPALVGGYGLLAFDPLTFVGGVFFWILGLTSLLGAGRLRSPEKRRSTSVL